MCEPDYRTCIRSRRGEYAGLSAQLKVSKFGDQPIISSACPLPAGHLPARQCKARPHGPPLGASDPRQDGQATHGWTGKRPTAGLFYPKVLQLLP